MPKNFTLFDTYYLHDYANKFKNSFESNTYAMTYLFHLLTQANSHAIQIFSVKNYGFPSTIRNEPEFEFRCEFQNEDIASLNYISDLLTCEIFHNKEKYILFIKEKFLYEKLKLKLNEIYQTLNLSGKIQEGEYKEFEYSEADVPAHLNISLKKIGLEVVTIPYPTHPIQGIKINDFTHLIESQKTPTEVKFTPRSIGFFPPSPIIHSKFKSLPDFSEAEKESIRSMQNLIKELKSEIQSCWSFFYNIDLKLCKIKYLQEIMGYKHLTLLPFDKCIEHVNKHFVASSRDYNRYYISQDALGGFFSNRVNDCIENVLALNKSATSILPTSRGLSA